MFTIESGTRSEQDLIKKAKQGNQRAINKLFKIYKPLLDYKAGAFRKAAMPFASIQAETYKLFMSALKKYDAVRGIQFKTFMENAVRPNRFVNTYKNIIRIPENRILEITRFKNTKTTLETMMGREPTPVELADHMGWSVNHVSKMEESLARQVFSASESMERKFSIGGVFQDRLKETSDYVYYQLPPQAQHVYDYSSGAHGKPKLDAKAITKKMGISMDKVYRIRRKIDAEIHGSGAFKKVATAAVPIIHDMCYDMGFDAGFLEK